MKTLSMLLLVVAATLVVPAAAVAQPAAAIGRPLGDASLRDGTLVVRVIEGDASKPKTDVEVTVRIARPDGQGDPIEKSARTDAEGRATFSDIAMGMNVQASIVGIDDARIDSTLFPMPETGGMRVMLSTVPVAAGPGPMAGGAGGPPMSPRMMSGQARGEAADARDKLTVRISYDDFADASDLAGVPVALVGYRSDLAVSGKVVMTDAAGRAEFTGLDVRGATSYFAMTLLPRGGDYDRLTSLPIYLDGEAGMRVMLSGDKRAAATPVIDDLTKLDEQPKEPLAPGVLRVQVAGVPEANAKVEVVDAATLQVVATAPITDPLIALDTITATAGAVTADPALAAGTLMVSVVDSNGPLAGHHVDLARNALVATSAPTGVDTDASGVATLTGLAAGEVELTIELDEDAVARVKVTKPATGGRVTVTIAAMARGEAGARLTGLPTAPDRAYFVRTQMRGQPYLSAPFQLSPRRGAAITVLVMPRIMFQFSLSSWLDDVFLGVRGTFGIRNASWAPFQNGTWDKPDELVLPLPAHFTGAVVREDFQEMVGIDPTRGFIIRRPLPPGGFQFVAAFSLKAHDGMVEWSMPLPLGTFESGIEFKQIGGSRVELPADVRGLKVDNIDDERGKFAVLSPITILPKQTMRFTIRDLPHEPPWRSWARTMAGVVVLALLAVGAGFALWRPRRGALPTARFDALLDELAALEAQGGDAARKAKLMDELETLYRDKQDAP